MKEFLQGLLIIVLHWLLAPFATELAAWTLSEIFASLVWIIGARVVLATIIDWSNQT